MGSRRSLLGIFALALGFSEVVSSAPTNTSSPDLTRLPAFKSKPRVFILSDILAEVDDTESFVRYLLYSNEFDTRGLCASTSVWLQNTTHPEAIREIVEAYGDVVDNLNSHVNPEAQYQNASTLLDRVTSGPTVFGKAALSIAPSEGALLLVQSLEESEEPLWVPAWGGINTLAQALQYIQHNYSADEAAALRSRLRVYTISDQDDSGPWIRANFPDIFYIVSIHAWNSYYASAWLGISTAEAGSDMTKVSKPWLGENIKIGGALADQYPLPLYIMEGDSPSFLYLVQNGLGHPEYPNWGSWGGRYGYVVPGSSQYSDTVDQVVGADGASYTSNKAGVYRWRDDFQNDFAARMQWTVTSDFGNASHPPVPVVNGLQGPDFLNITVAAGQTVVLDGSESYDPDHPDTTENLQFEWYHYAEPTEYVTSPGGLTHLNLTALTPPEGTNGTLPNNDAGFQNVVLGETVGVDIPSDKTGLAYHIILQVTSQTAALPLRRYLRVVLNVEA
ncbi:hypothetical protein FJTKL_15353 [Diaporthe vaccinii]|uniref:Cellulose-binding protein n=1 Tax=Diaporthe vaccinii TaxID=105482 RepID=A0ABR4E5C5_9PEZI